MLTRLTIVALSATVVVLVAFIATGPGGCSPRASVSEPEQRSPVPAGYIASAPITMTVSSSGADMDKTWWLSVNSAGQAQVMRSGEHPKTFQIPQEDWDAFRKALERERFFELDAEYGEVVVDGSAQTLTVTVGSVTRSVTVHYLMNLPQPKRREAERAARPMAMVERWIEAMGVGE